jgi:serine/threonine protein kinase
LAPVLSSSGRHFKLDPRCPLPFLEMDSIGAGPFSIVYKSLVHVAHYDGSMPDMTTPRVAAKEFRSKDPFCKERDNLETIRKLDHAHLIKHLATYEKEALYYVIFPWANGGSLRDFWKVNDTRSRDTKLVLWSLRQMLGLAEALEALHRVNCRHGDLKPENILHFDEGNEDKLIVADVGVSRTHKQATQFRHVGTTTRATTPSYEAPEAFTNHSAPRARRYDIWSLGCIFLEFAIWLFHDLEAIDTFSLARHGPTFEFYLLNRDSSESSRTPVIHPMVTRVIESLRQDIRCKSGTAFEAFINLIADHLLQVEVEQRASADVIVQKLRKIVEDAAASPSTVFNKVHSPPEKLRFLPRTQTGAQGPSQGVNIE